MWQLVPLLDLPVNRWWVKIVEHGKVEAECCNFRSLFINLNSRKLIFQNLFKLIKNKWLPFFMPLVPDNTAKCLHQKNSRPASRVQHA